ncbi:hypothetical protein [Halomarina halobia]|nr:hypothetical protein [Halomarina sp. PSR21]
MVETSTTDEFSREEFERDPAVEIGLGNKRVRFQPPAQVDCETTMVC